MKPIVAVLLVIGGWVCLAGLAIALVAGAGIAALKERQERNER